ncbi:PQQ-binding-like beta-propeller repeat protein [Micromonospora sp. CPCC 205539]|uniref:outer membrane protein assembly factor BamB family protein n=1 Tax=Micromonospora sp. CPCC 205539 TaxID=3122408 RepID=UPI002FEFAEA7
MSIIELGVVRDEPASARPPRAYGRRLRGALVLLLAFVTLVAAVPLPQRAVVTLPVRPGADVLVADDLVLVVDQTTAESAQRRMTAYRLPSGEPAWQTLLPVDGDRWGVTPLAGRLLVSAHQDNLADTGTQTVALDRETGAVGWHQPGGAIELADGNVLLQLISDTGTVGRAVDPCCGTTRWQLPNAVGEISYRYAEAGVDRLVRSGADGSVEVRDATTGSVLSRAELRAPGGTAYASVHVVGDLLIAIGGVPATVTAYGMDRLDERWRLPTDDESYASDCGPVICLQRPTGEQVVLDTAGRTLWSSDRWGWMFPSGGRLVATTNDSIGPAGPQQLVVLDPPTGRVLAELGRWELAGSDPGNPLVGLRPRPDGGLLAVGLDVDAGAVRTLDVLPDARGNCYASVGRVLCQRADGSYGLWQVPK